MSSANMDAVDLAGVARHGLINEEVMQKIFDISKIPLPFQDRVGTEKSRNQYKSWVTDALIAPDTGNAYIDGAVLNTQNDTNPDETGAVTDGEPLRQGNHHQISTKVVNVSSRARNVDTIGAADVLAYQVMMRGRELRRDMEAILLTHQASVAADTAVAPKLGGLGSWISTNYLFAGTGTVGGYNTADGLTDSPAITATAALTEKDLRDVSELIYTQGGIPDILISVPTVTRAVSEYMFTSSSRIATLTSDTGQGKQPLTAQGAVNVLVFDNDVVLTLVPNRLQQPDATNQATAYLLDTSYLSVSYLQRPIVEPLAKTGLSDLRAMHTDYTLVVKSQRAQGAVFGIDTTAAVTSG